MKALTYLCCLAVASAAFAIDEESAVEVKKEAVIVTIEADDAGNLEKKVKVLRLDGDGTVVAGDTDGPHAIFVRALADRDEGGDRNVRVFTRMAAMPDENRGWLGVALGESIEREGVAEEVDSGVVVVNVVKDSPAERAGLQRNDIITAVNGTPVTEGVGALARVIGELGPDADAVLSILRDGEPMDVTATLGAPQPGSIQWNHAPDITLREKFRTLPRFGMVTPHGKMKILCADDLDELPEAVVELLNQNGMSMQMSVRNGRRAIEIKNDDNGEVLEIRQEGDGPIVVKRYTAGNADDATEAEYADAAALEAADVEAYEIYQRQADRTANVWLNQGGDGSTFDFDISMDVDVSYLDFDKLHENLMGQFQGLHMSGEAMAEAHEAIQNALGDVELEFAPGHHTAFFGKAVRSFKVQPDGNIEMTVRKGDTEVVTVFTGEADLEARDPDAFTRYQDVMNAEVDE